MVVFTLFIYFQMVGIRFFSLASITCNRLQLFEIVTETNLPFNRFSEPAIWRYAQYMMMWISSLDIFNIFSRWSFSFMMIFVEFPFFRSAVQLLFLGRKKYWIWKISTIFAVFKIPANAKEKCKNLTNCWCWNVNHFKRIDESCTQI